MAKIIPLLRRILKDTEFEAIRLWLVNMDMNPRKKAFSGLFHMFTVSLRRVGYAAAPMQLSDEDYEKLCDLGRKKRRRYNIKTTYPPYWDIDIFGEPEESSTANKIKIV